MRSETPSSNTKLDTFMPSACGFAFIGVCFAILAWLVPDEEVRRPMWFFIFIAVAVCAKFCWDQPAAPTTLSGWLKYVVAAGVVGLGLAAIDVVFYGVDSGHVILDFSLSVVGAIIALSGAIHTVVTGKLRGV